MSAYEMRVSLRLARIKGYRESGITVGQHDVDWLLGRLDTLTIELEEQRKAYRESLGRVAGELEALTAELFAEQKRRYDGNEAAEREYAEQGCQTYSAGKEPLHD